MDNHEEDTRNNMDDYIENRKRMLREMNDADKAAMSEGFEPPSLEKIMQVIDGLAGVTEEDKDKLRKRIAERAASTGESVGDFVRKSAASLGGGGNAKKATLPPGFNSNRIKENLISASSDYEMYLFIFMVTVVLLVFGEDSKRIAGPLIILFVANKNKTLIILY